MTDRPSKFERLELLGRSDGAAIHLGRHIEFGHDVAIKQLDPSLFANLGRRDRFLREADLWPKRPHDHLLTLLDIDRSRCWIVMELMNGSPTIEAYQDQRRPLPTQRARTLLCEALKGLHFLHSEGFLHGNLKATNILFDSRGRVRLCDGRGISLDRCDELPQPTGSRKYLAPEMLEDKQKFGPIGIATDLYCLGMVALEWLLGARFNSCFQGVGPEAVDLETAWICWHTSANDRAPRLRDVRPDCPAALDDVFFRLLTKQVLQRYHSAAEVLDDLDRAWPTEGEPVEPSRPVPSYVAQPVDLIAAPISSAISPLPPQSKTSASSGDEGSFPASDVVVPASIAARPAFPVLIRNVCGPDVGTFAGENSDELFVGDTERSTVRFSRALYPYLADRDVQIRREVDGWRLRTQGFAGVMINRTLVSGEAVLRSGDIVRLSFKGPDFQFILQSVGSPSLELIAAGYSATVAKRRNSRAAPPTPAPAPSRMETRDKPATVTENLNPPIRPLVSKTPSGIDPRAPLPPKSATTLEEDSAAKLRARNKSLAIILGAVLLGGIILTPIPSGCRSASEDRRPGAGPDESGPAPSSTAAKENRKAAER